MRRKLGTALAAAAMVMTFAGCGGGDDSSSESSSSGGSSESAEPTEDAAAETDSGGEASVDEIAEKLEAAGTEGTPEEFRCLAEALLDAGLTGDQIVGILSEDPEVASDPDVMSAFDEAGPEVGKCYGVGS